MNDPADAPPIVPPLQRHLQLETDLFCHGCGYNLHGQVVTHDERLNFLVCRCPECGRFHPAAMGVSASRPWLARLGVMLISIWMLTAVLVLGLGGLFIGMCSYAHLDNYTESTRLSPGGPQIRILTAPPTDPNALNSYLEYRAGEWKYFAFWNSVLSLGLGMYTAVMMWHVSRHRLWLLQVYGLFIGAMVYSLWWASYDISQIWAWSITRVLAYAGWSVALMTVGQIIGRPVARFAIRLVIPPKLRQHVNFLWWRDGKTPPPLKTEMVGRPVR